MRKKLLAAALAVFGALIAIVLMLQKKTSQGAVVVPQAQPQNDNATSTLQTLNLINSSSILDTLLNPQEENTVKLRYFKPEEFGGWYDKMNPDLLKKLDEFRHQWGFPVMVSPHHDAVGREHPTSQSQHNILKWGEVRAVDVFPKNSVGGYINSAAERQRAYDIAKRVGFTGIGLYTDTQPGNMVHLDVRTTGFAKWSRIDGKYKGINEALV